LRRMGVAEVAETKLLYDTVKKLDSVGTWGGCSLAHCLWTFLLRLWRGPEVLLTPLGDDAHGGPPAVGSCTEVPGKGEQHHGRHVKVFAVTDDSLKDKAEYMQDAIVALLPQVLEGCVRLYHATSVNRVTAIVQNGILPSTFKDTSNFGHGFYMTPDIGCGVHFLMNEAPPQPHEWPRALLAVDVDRAGLEALSEMPQLREGGDVWDAVVGAKNPDSSGNAFDALPRAVLKQYFNAEVLVGPLTTRAARRRLLGDSDEAPWTQYAFKEPDRVDPYKFLDELEDTLVCAVNVVRILNE